MLRPKLSSSAQPGCWFTVAVLLGALAATVRAQAAGGEPSVAATSSPTPPVQTTPGPLRNAAFEQLLQRARDLAQHDFVPREAKDLPEWLGKLDYDGYRNLRFRPEAALWATEDLPFQVQFLHRGYLFPKRVPVDEVIGEQTREVPFSPTQFAYPDGTPPVSPGLGFSGLSFSWRAPDTRRRDEIAEFQGASYYRVLGVGQVYGASARGLAVDVAEPKGEEFPEFTELWLERPAPGDAQVVLDALLDSPGIAGAFRFVIAPGARTSADVTAVLYPRHPIGKLGLAPLTSMFLFGEDGLHRTPDWRPEVHDSDGLLVAGADGGWTWRPLCNPVRSHRVTRLPMEHPAGFGLLQRDRAFASYADLESHFELRPSLWITPRGDWGKGALELVEIPNEGEWNENVIASWVPEQPVTAGQELRFEYTLTAQLQEPERPPLAHVTATRVRPGKDSQPSSSTSTTSRRSRRRACRRARMSARAAARSATSCWSPTPRRVAGAELRAGRRQARPAGAARDAAARCAGRVGDAAPRLGAAMSIEASTGTAAPQRPARRRRLRARRSVFLGSSWPPMRATVGLLLANMIRVNGTTPLEAVIFVLTLVLLVPIVFSFWTAVAGFLVELRGRDPLALDLAQADALAPPLAPTALVVPVRTTRIRRACWPASAPRGTRWSARARSAPSISSC